MDNLQLSLAFAENGRTRPVLDGRVKVQGIDFVHTNASMQELAWRQLHAHEFDVSEFSMSSLIAARSKGDDSFIGIPIFSSRSFMQTNVLVREDSDIEKPAQLVGKRIGVPEYQQTAALWARGILQHEFGVDPTSCHWYMERLPEQSHGGTTGFTPPPGLDFHYIPWESSIVDMMRAGELDASLLGGSPGAVGSPRAVVNANRRESSLAPGSGLRRLFADPRAEGRRYYQKTGIFPINHGAAVSKEVIERHPWVALNVYRAFNEAKELWADEVVKNLEPFVDTGVLDPDVEKVARTDLYAYGVKANRKVLEAILDYSFEQGLSARRMSVEEVFYPPTVEL